MWFVLFARGADQLNLAGLARNACADAEKSINHQRHKCNKHMSLRKSLFTNQNYAENMFFLLIA